MRLRSFKVVSLRSNNWARGAELVNRELRQHNIAPEKIVSIVPIGAKDEMGGDTDAYEVFYLEEEK